MPRSKGVVLLLLAGILSLSSNSWGGNNTPTDQIPASSLQSIRTYVAQDFREPWLDRLSGGLMQQFPYRMATDSRGNLYTAEVNPGSRVQRFIFKGVKPQ